MKLTLIRHGQTEGTVRNLYYGSTDLPLTEAGVACLRRAAKTYCWPKAEVYYTSGMLRTEQTFSILYPGQEHGVLPGLREIDFGVFEMRSYEQLRDDPQFQAWITGDVEKNVCPGGESGEQTTHRALAEIQRLLEQGKDAVCVLHGGVIAGLMGSWFPEGNRYTWSPEPGSGFTVTFDRQRPQSYERIPKTESAQ